MAQGNIIPSIESLGESINILNKRVFKHAENMSANGTYDITLPVDDSFYSTVYGQVWLITATGSYQSVIHGAWLAFWGISQPGQMTIISIGSNTGVTLTNLSAYDKAVRLKNTYSSGDTITFTVTCI